MDILNQVQTFINSKQFWLYHGFVLSGLWVLLSSFAILAKRFSTLLHACFFIVINATTIFFAGAALWRVSAGFDKFMEWPLLKKGHVSAGSLFLVFLIIQHLGGLVAFLGKKKNPQHRSFGKILVIFGRIIAAVGWILGGNQRNAVIVGVVSVVLLGLALVLDSPTKSKASQKQQSKKNERSKSPRSVKRQ